MPDLLTDHIHVYALGDEAVIVKFGDHVDSAVNEQVCYFAQAVRDASLPWVIDVVPSFTACTVHYSATLVNCERGASPFDAVARALKPLAEASTSSSLRPPDPVIAIPVCYGNDMGPDLLAIAHAKGVSERHIIDQHTGAEDLRVYMIGFLPGAPYIGRHSDLFAVPRRVDPRIQVPWGSVGIANRQTMIYPASVPGGWNLIGRTPMSLFSPAGAGEAALKPGSRVRFVEIDERTFKEMSQP